MRRHIAGTEVARGWALVLSILVVPLLLPAPPPARAAAAPAVGVRIEHYAYTPAVLTIAPGTTVRWTNLQTDTNDVVVREGPVHFRSPSLRPGAFFEFTFTEPGTYRYTCTPHPFMTGEVRVVPDERATFPETGVAVEGAFLRHWRAHGLDLGDPGVSHRESLALFGYPPESPRQERLEGRDYLVQYFERARFEHHPENPQPHDILLGQFGRALHPPDPPAAPLPGAEYFPATGHNLAGRFRTFWVANGGLPVLGLPLSEEFVETLEDGKSYTVQYFERARVEHHPENPAPYDVLLGQFGRRFLPGP
jgi:plastocyanin